MSKYKINHIEIEAIQWDGINLEEISDLCNDKYGMLECENGKDLEIYCKNGVNICSDGDYVIKIPTGECYPMNKYLFEIMYKLGVIFNAKL